MSDRWPDYTARCAGMNDFYDTCYALDVFELCDLNVLSDNLPRSRAC
jgi:hypothetical protein